MEHDPVTDSRLSVVIASPLEDECVERIRSVAPDRVRVVHEPDLIPRPLYASDHDGVLPDLDADGIARWLGILREADVLFDFDWYAPDDLPVNAPRLRWVQAISREMRSGLPPPPVPWHGPNSAHRILCRQKMKLLNCCRSSRINAAWQTR